MATKDLKLRFGIDGEAEYKKALNEMNNDLKMLNSEMYKVTQEYANNSKSIDALRAKQEILTEKEKQQSDQVERLKDLLEKLAKQGFKETSEEVQYFTKELNYAEGNLSKTVAEIEKLDDAIAKDQKGMWGFATETKGMGDILDTVGSKFGISLPNSVKTSMNSMAQFSVVGVGAVTAVIAIVKELIDVEKKLVNITTEAASEADNILTLSQVTGLDTDTIQEIQYASELIDVSFDTIQSSMTKLKRNMDSARDGNEKLSQSFEDLGVSITNNDGSLRSSEDVFYDVIDALGQISNETERDTVAMELMGKSAETLNPLIIQGTDTMRSYADEAHNVSAVMSEEQLASLGEVDDAYQRLQEQQDATKQQIAVELAPAVTEFYTAWTKFIKETGEMFVKSGIIDFFANILQIVSAVIPLFEALIETILPDFGKGFDNIGEIVDKVCLRLATLVDILKTMINIPASIGRLITTGEFVDTSTTKAYIKYSSGDAEGFTKNENGTYTGNYFNASGDQNFVGGYTMVGESGPELVSLPQGSTIYNNQDTRNMGNSIYNITIDAKNVKEFNDIIKIVKSSRQNARMRA